MALALLKLHEPLLLAQVGWEAAPASQVDCTAVNAPAGHPGSCCITRRLRINPPNSPALCSSTLLAQDNPGELLRAARRVAAEAYDRDTLMKAREPSGGPWLPPLLLLPLGMLLGRGLPAAVHACTAVQCVQWSSLRHLTSQSASLRACRRARRWRLRAWARCPWSESTRTASASSARCALCRVRACARPRRAPRCAALPCLHPCRQRARAPPGGAACSDC